MWVTLKTALRTLVLPPSGPLLLALLGLALLSGGTRARRLALGLVGAGLALLWLLATPVIADQLAYLVDREPALDLERARQAQALVILGGGDERRAPEYDDAPAPGAKLLERIAYGAYVARRTRLPILVSGTTGETEAMRASLQRDFDLEVRWVEDASRDTFENAQFSARLLRSAGISRIVLITHAAHEYRAVQEFTSAGLAVVPAPVGMWVTPRPRLMRYLPTSAALDRSSEALYELLGEGVRRALATLHLRRHGT